MNLELLALRWLLYEKRCLIALRERSPRSVWCGEPDVLGLTKSRHTVEIEIKRSLSDFRADGRKRSRQELFRNTERARSLLPRQFYYLVPPELVGRVQEELPTWAGLMRLAKGEWALTVIKDAPVNPDSTRLSVKECCRLVRMVANWATTEAESLQAQFNRFRYGHQPWPEPDFEI